MRPLCISRCLSSALFAASLGACAAHSEHASAPQQAAHEAEEEKQAAQESARNAQKEAQREQQEAQEAKRTQREAEQKAQWASERAALAEAQAAHEAKWQSGKGPGTTDRQAEVVSDVPGKTDVLFGINSADLSAEAKAKLDQLAQSLRAQPQAHDVLVQGYTDDAGPESTNVQLSQHRAENVADYLQSKGVPRDRVASKALGSMHPATHDATDRGRALNRRVEVVVQPVGRPR